MRVNGAAVTDAIVTPGDTLSVSGQLVLYCTRRAAIAPPLRHFPSEAKRAFGEADATGIIGESPASWTLRESIAFAAKAGTHTLLLGQSGTGKELAARAIHSLSGRAARPLVSRNAATLPAGLIDAELFGNLRNYPNPGTVERPGLIGGADGGFLFLDEVGDLPSDLQAHLLRVLDGAGEYQRLGEASVRRSDFVLLGATNRDSSTLKHDLLARMTGRVELPALADRREDIPLLVRHLLLRAATRSPEIVERFLERDAGRSPWPRIAPSLIEHLLKRDYPSNTRELEALLWNAMRDSEGDRLELSEPLVARSEGGRPSEVGREPSADEIRAAMEQAGGNVRRAARALGVSSRYALYRLLKRHGIDTGPADEDE
jgi:DNA-binding NtrC family response regulator